MYIHYIDVRMNRLLFLFFFSSLVIQATAQKSVTLEKAEESLQKNNLLLLAEYYNVSASRAAIIQAKIWSQPYVSAELNAYNPEADRFFDVGPEGQKAIAIEQLIYMGGKRKGEINFMKSNAAIAELEFEHLLRTLQLQLSQHFYTIYFEQQKVVLLEKQINKLDTLVRTYQLQSDKGNIPLMEVVRLQTLLLSLRMDRNTAQGEVIQSQQQFRLLTGEAENIVPQIDEKEVEHFQLAKLSQADLLVTAVTHPEYLIAAKISESQELYLKWQRSLNVPDLTTGLSYDQRSGAFQNQVNLTLGFSLPLWSKNKGNIKAAQAQVSASTANKDYKKAELENRITSAWEIWKQQQEQLLSVGKSVNSNLEEVYKGMLTNFQKRNITLLEFTDFMESYNQSNLQLNEMKKQLILSGINLNYVTNTELF